jgi:hypothetical protein
MSEQSKSRYHSFGLTLASAGLALSVFFWGLGYKLSLYDAQRLNSHRIPTASLLSRNEDPTTKNSVSLSGKASAFDHAASPVLSIALLFSLFVLADLSLPNPGWHRRQIALPWRIRTRASLTAFSFRPPPASFLL